MHLDALDNIGLDKPSISSITPDPWLQSLAGSKHHLLWPPRPVLSSRPMLADRPSLSPLALVSATGLFTWPRVTDSQPHVWSLETDKASLHPPRSGLYRATVCARECVCVFVCARALITSGPSTRLRPTFTVNNRWDQSRQSVCSRSADLPFGHTLTADRLRVRVCVFMCECIHSCKPLRTIPGIVTDGVIVTSQ